METSVCILILPGREEKKNQPNQSLRGKTLGAWYAGSRGQLQGWPIDTLSIDLSSGIRGVRGHVGCWTGQISIYLQAAGPDKSLFIYTDKIIVIFIFTFFQLFGIIEGRSATDTIRAGLTIVQIHGHVYLVIYSGNHSANETSKPWTQKPADDHLIDLPDHDLRTSQFFLSVKLFTFFPIGWDDDHVMDFFHQSKPVNG
nr:hypothetical protein BgiMline_025087 [Biomphalaria glabrata]